MRIVVLGYIVRGPIGGLAWHHLQYVLGLKRLGHDVLFLEDSDDYPACYDPTILGMTVDPSFGLAFAADAFNRVGLQHDWCYHDAHSNKFLGPAAATAKAFCRSADMLLNLSGANPLRSWTSAVPLRVFIDTDPAFTQIRALTTPSAKSLLTEHNSFFTFGENIAHGCARLPDDGIAWRATRQPIVIDQWPVSNDSACERYTTVMQWESYPPVSYDGLDYGTKSTSFRPFINFPSRVARPLEIALGSDSAPHDLLRQHGWCTVNPLEVCRTPWDYRDYIGQSRGEFTVAKHGYTQSHCGWFSERSAAYLASGKPVVTEETGFSRWLPVGQGLFAFADPESAAAALEQVESDYTLHSKAARGLAEEYFASDRILSLLIEDAQA